MSSRPQIDGEDAYFIYKFYFDWKQDGEHDPNYPESRRHKEMPEGRIRNSTSFSKLFKDEQSEEELQKLAKTFWETYHLTGKIKDLNPLDMEFKHKHYIETWNCSWFGHETFDTGKSDSEVLDSFENYVRRHEDYQDMYLDNPSRLPENPICLMGAEDRWRWYGTQDKDTGDRSSAPCRCQGCKDSGMVRISH